MTSIPSISEYHWRYLAVLLVISALAFFGFHSWLGVLVPVETLLRRDFVQTVVASGHVENPHRVNVGTQITGTVVAVPVSEGQAVDAQALLISLAETELQANQRQTEIAVEQAEAKLRQLREVQAPIAEQTTRQALINLENAKSNLQRNTELFNKGFIGEAALQDSRKAADVADAQWRSSQRQLDTTRTSGSDYAVAETAVAQARAAAQAARARTDYARIVAPVAGVLIARNVEVGDMVQPGKVLMTLSPKGRTQLVLAIDEKNLHLIAVGQKALVSADAYPQQKFEAVIAFINPGINAQTGAVEVKLDVPKSPEFLSQDMTVSVDIEVARRPKALVVTTAALHDQEGSTQWVLRVEGNHAVKVPVYLGLRSGGFAEVLDGLQEHDLVIPADSKVAPGQRIRFRASGR